ncbi:AI-2E family transporter [Microbacterium sp. AK031]|uniref:AI-2E family transporter n=1 Tax=Microbacterium sp. AK031 TaxID=2723076 RepID=UPI00216861F7|nr:AI-2E family transporter [Microbacterium sp. AK031]MCS3844971.1 putative PurR-regulated permease PerM [Microbacterium sp. AK031]
MSTDEPAADDDTTADEAPVTRRTAAAAKVKPETSKAAETEPPAAPEVKTKPVIEPVLSSRSFWTRIERPFGFGFLVTLGGLAAILLGLALSNLSTVIIYIALALFAALGLDPAVRFLERRGLNRGWGVVIVLFGLVIALGLVIWAIVPVVVAQITSFVKDVPGMISDFQTSDIYTTLEGQFGEQFQTLVSDVQGFLTDPGNIAAIGGGALQVGASIANGISGAVIVLVLVIYFVATLPGMKRAMLRLVPARDRANADIISTEITDSVGGYVMGMVTLAFMNAVLVLILYTVLSLPFPLLLAVVAFLITLIPLVGPLLFWVIGTGIALFGDNIIFALVFAVVYLIYMQVESYFLTPKVMNRAISIPGSLVVIGALVGGTLLGLLGALVAVPVAASILIIIKKIWIPRQDSRV